MSGRTTLVGTPVVAAPGKIFLVGEYAVLDGGVAVLAAVSRYAVAQYVPGTEPQSAVVGEAVKHSLTAIGEASAALPPGSVLVDTDAFCQGKFKIGLGSSAATAVATVGAMFETAGLSIEHMQHEVFSTAEAAHRAALGRRRGRRCLWRLHQVHAALRRPPHRRTYRRASRPAPGCVLDGRLC